MLLTPSIYVVPRGGIGLHSSTSCSLVPTRPSSLSAASMPLLPLFARRSDGFDSFKLKWFTGTKIH